MGKKTKNQTNKLKKSSVCRANDTHHGAACRYNIDSDAGRHEGEQRKIQRLLDRSVDINKRAVV